MLHSNLPCQSNYPIHVAEPRPIIYVVDDDPSVRDAVSNLLESVGHRSKVFESTEEFLKATRPDVPGCLVLDIRLPGMGGLEFQDELQKLGVAIPIIFVTAHGDIPMTSRAIKAGAIEFLTKPFQKKDLLAAIDQALDCDRARRKVQAELGTLRSRFDHLTARERDVMSLVVMGLTNKEAAAKLGVAEITVKVHRGQVMKKLEAGSLAELVRIAQRLNLQSHR